MPTLSINKAPSALYLLQSARMTADNKKLLSRGAIVAGFELLDPQVVNVGPTDDSQAKG